MNGLAFAVTLTVIGNVLSAFASLFLKKGSARLNFNLFSQLKNYFVILGIFLSVVSAVIYVFALKYAELSVLYPFAALTYVFIAFLSIKYLNEKMNAYKWAGIALILIGVVLVTR